MVRVKLIESPLKLSSPASTVYIDERYSVQSLKDSSQTSLCHSKLLLSVLANRLSDHDIHLDRLFVPMKIDLLLQFEPHLAIDLQVDIMRALEVASLAILVRLSEVS